MRRARRLFDLLVGRFRVPVDEVLPDGPLEEHRFLRDDTDRPPKVGQGEGPYVDPVQHHAPLLDVEEPG